MGKNVLSNEELVILHEYLLNMLIDFDRVCRANGIKYILDGGTLLGAVRHQGFIPWDDDIDIRMLRSEYNKFVNVSDQLSPQYCFQNHCNDKGYPWIYAKLRVNGTLAIQKGQEKLKMHQGIFADIFVCDGVPNDTKKLKKRNTLAWLARKILYSRIAAVKEKKILKKIWWHIVSLVPKSIAYRIEKYLAREYSDEKCNKVGCTGWHEHMDVYGMKKEWFTDLTELSFEGHSFFAPSDWKGMLSYFYGDDFMIPPPESERKGSTDLMVLQFN